MRTPFLALVLLSGCFQGVDVGSEFNQLTTVSQGDGGAVVTRDPCPPRAWDAGPGPCEGGLTIHDTSEWEAFQSLRCETFCGDLEIVQNGETPWGPATVLPAGLTDTALTTVTGKLHIWGTSSVTSITFQELRSANGIDISVNDELESVNLPNLSTTNSFVMGTNRKLTALNAPALTHFRDGFIWNNVNLTVLNLPSLTTVPDRLVISRNSSLRQCVADAVFAGLWMPPPRSESFENFGAPNVCP